MIGRNGQQAQLTREVLDEISDGLVAGYTALGKLEDAVQAGTLGVAAPLTPRERDLYRPLLHFLGAGEASCIVCAQARGGTVVSDDRAARDACAERGLKKTGTIGILKAWCLDRTLSPQEADQVLQEMVAAGFYSPISRISDTL